jgi:hypothetical protein
VALVSVEVCLMGARGAAAGIDLATGPLKLEPFKAPFVKESLLPDVFDVFEAEGPGSSSTITDPPVA